MKIYLYLYYRLYIWNQGKRGDASIPHYNAMLGVSFMMFANFYLLCWLVQILGINVIIREETPILAFSLISIMFLIFNSFRFLYKSKYLKIVSSFSNESKKTRIIRSVILYLYVFLSFLLIVLAALVYQKIHN